MFSREKPAVEGLPTPPNQREILEDIESCQKTDPIFELAQLLSKRSKLSVTEVSKPTDKSNKDLQIQESEDGSPSSSKSSAQSKKGSKKKGTKGTDKKSSLDQRDKEKAYLNLIQCTTVCEQTTELISDIEPTLKKLGTDMKEFLQTLEVSQQNVKSGGDNDSVAVNNCETSLLV